MFKNPPHPLFTWLRKRGEVVFPLWFQCRVSPVDELIFILLFFPHPTPPPPRYLAANVCDNELLHCQNGGTCINNVRCQCPPAYTGILCEKLKCERDPGGCSQNSGQGPVSHGPLLLLTALLGATGLCIC